MKRAIIVLILLFFCPFMKADDFPWVIKTDSPDKVILRMDVLEPSFRFEFWFDGDCIVLTRDTLIVAAESIQNARIDSKRVCQIDKEGTILNYPCKIKPAKKRP